MTTLYARAYDISATGFCFDSAEAYDAKVKLAVNDYGQPVEEFEIQFIDGSDLDCALAGALGINQANFGRYFELCESFDDWQKIKAIIAVGECGYCSKIIDENEDFEDIEIYEMQSIRELAEHFVDEGLMGDIPENLSRYFDYDALARDLEIEYSEIEIAGTRYVYACH